MIQETNHQGQRMKNLNRLLKKVVKSKLFKILLIFSAFLVQNSIMGGINHLTVGAGWYVMQLTLQFILLILSFTLKEMRAELTLVIGLGMIANFITLEDFLLGSNVLYEHYPTIMTFLYHTAIGAFFINFMKIIYTAYKDYSFKFINFMKIIYIAYKDYSFKDKLKKNCT